MDCRTALLTVLDQVDYTAGNCRQNEMVGAVLPKEVIELARKAIADADEQIEMGVEIAKQVYEEQQAVQQTSQTDVGDDADDAVYTRPECIYVYCPNPVECKAGGNCAHPFRVETLS